MALLFFLLTAFILYTYLGYPLALQLKSLFRSKYIQKRIDREYPFVSVIVAARNEEENIADRARNIRDQAYPKDRIELIIVSDGSTDSTNDIIETIMKRGNPKEDFLKFDSHFPSRGKPSCLNKAIYMAKGEIIVFADARQRFEADVIGVLVDNFSDPRIGCVSGELILEETPGSSIQTEMGSYWRFEKWLRKLESETGSVPGATGAIYAIRKELFRPLPAETLLDDVLIPMRVCMQGYRTVFDEKAIAYDSYSLNLDLEKKRKVRTLAGNWQLIFLEPHLLNPAENPIWIRFVSHKIFRLLVPYCIVALVFLSFCHRTTYTVFFLTLLIIGSIAWAIPPQKGKLSIFSKIGSIFGTVIILNYFGAIAPFKLIFGNKRLW